MKILPKIVHVAKRIFVNKYLLTLVAFAVWLSFFDANSLLLRLKVAQQNAALAKEISYYRQALETDQAQIDKLSTTEALETFARENYLMKKPNEEIFIFR